jgi:hypothetical protein
VLRFRAHRNFAQYSARCISSTELLQRYCWQTPALRAQLSALASAPDRSPQIATSLPCPTAPLPSPRSDRLSRCCRKSTRSIHSARTRGSPFPAFG